MERRSPGIQQPSEIRVRVVRQPALRRRLSAGDGRLRTSEGDRSSVFEAYHQVAVPRIEISEDAQSFRTLASPHQTTAGGESETTTLPSELSAQLWRAFPGCWRHTRWTLHQHEPRRFQMPHEALGRDPGHRVVRIVHSLSAAVA
jgi:hypothetical protein